MTNQPFKISRQYPSHQFENWISQTEELIRTTVLPDNVLYWGVKGDGVTNDTAAVQRAFNSLSPNGGIFVFSPWNLLYTWNDCNSFK